MLNQTLRLQSHMQGNASETSYYFEWLTLPCRVGGTWFYFASKLGVLLGVTVSKERSGCYLEVDHDISSKLKL
jgi:hypothetical protein